MSQFLLLPVLLVVFRSCTMCLIVGNQFQAGVMCSDLKQAHVGTLAAQEGI